MRKTTRLLPDEAYSRLRRMLLDRGHVTQDPARWEAWRARWKAALGAAGTDEGGFRGEVRARGEILAGLESRPAWAIFRAPSGETRAEFVTARGAREGAVLVVDGDDAPDTLAAARAMGVGQGLTNG